MAELTKFRINGADYDLKDETARQNSGGGISVTGAHVGQTVKIAEVDANGVPTAWESVDFPSGGEETKEWEEFIRFTTDNAETTVFDFSSNGTETLESKKVKEFYLYSPHCNSGDCSGAITVNESVTIENLLNFCRPTGTLKLSLAVSPEALKFRYFGRDTDLHFNTPAATFATAMGQSLSNNTKHFAFNITEMRDGIPFPSSSVDYIKTVTVTLQSPCLSGVEFIVYVR